MKQLASPFVDHLLNSGWVDFTMLCADVKLSPKGRLQS